MFRLNPRKCRGNAFNCIEALLFFVDSDVYININLAVKGLNVSSVRKNTDVEGRLTVCKLWGLPL